MKPEAITLTRCESCGADLPQDSSVCEYCGARHSRPAAGDASRAAAFSRIKASPQYAARNAAEVLKALPAMPMFALAIPVVFLLVFCGAALLMAGGMATMAPGFTKLMALVPLGISVVGALGLGTVIQKAAKFRDSPVESHAAIVVGKRSHVSGGSGDSSASTHYFLTFEFEGGDREELQPMTPAIYSRLAEGDAGILYRRSDILQDFRRV